MKDKRRYHLWLAVAVMGAAACGGDSGTNPTEVTFGETTVVFVVNPAVNTINDTGLTAPGATLDGITVSIDGGPSGTTDSTGVVVLSQVPTGNFTVNLDGGGDTGTINVTMADKDLREVAVSLTAAGAEIMANVLYAFGGQVIEVTPTTSTADVNGALAQSNTVVFFSGGTYAGDLSFSGSNVTLFGEGDRGGQVTLSGTVIMGGSNNRIRGATITSGLDISGSGFGFSFSRLIGALSLPGSAARSPRPRP